MSHNARTSSQPEASLYGVKPRFVQALEPIRTLLEKRGVAPTTITMAAIPVEVAVAILLIVGALKSWLLLVFVPLLTLCWMCMNALDGSLARSTGRTTARGAVFNELVDRLSKSRILFNVLSLTGGIHKTFDFTVGCSAAYINQRIG